MAEMQALALPSLSTIEAEDFRVAGGARFFLLRLFRQSKLTRVPARGGRKSPDGYDVDRGAEEPEGLHRERVKAQKGGPQAREKQQGGVAEAADCQRGRSALSGRGEVSVLPARSDLPATAGKRPADFHLSLVHPMAER